MSSNIDNIKVERSNNLANNIVIIDGQPGCGKTLFSKIITSFKRVEILNYAFDIEYIARLFSTPVFQSPETYKFNKSELEFIDKQRENAIINQSGNLFSKNNYVLESPELKNLKEFCNNNLFIFFYDSFKVKKDIEIYITQSWINFNQKNTSHHRHKHVNSIISSGKLEFVDDYTLI